MATISLEDTLVKTKILKCQICCRLIETPIMLLKNTGSVCYACYKELEDEDGVFGLENTPLQTLLSRVNLACMYESEGCDQKLKYENLHAHLLQCNYRPVACIFKSPPSPCNIVYRLKDFVNHFLEYHKDAILSDPDAKDTFTFVMSSHKSDIIAMLKTSCGAFIIRMKFLEKRVACLIYNTGEISKSLRYNVTMEFAENQDRRIHTSCKVIEDLKILIDFEENVATMLHLEPYDEDFLSNLELKVLFATEDINIKMNNCIIQFLECPICKCYMVPPIHQCVSGHNICDSCKTRVDQCSFCKSYYQGARNYTLEELSSKTLFPCNFEEQGCITLSPSAEDHEIICKFRLWKCPSKDCSETDVYPKLLEHVRNKHLNVNAKKKNDKISNDTKRISSTNLNAQYFIKYDYIFELKYSHDLYRSVFKVHVFGPVKKQEKHAFQIDIFKGNNVSISFIGSCEHHTSQKNIAVGFNDDHLEPFVEDINSFDYTITISKLD